MSADPHPMLPAAEGWQHKVTAPKTATWVQLGYIEQHARKPSIVIAHWARDMSGEEQPPFEGWFRHNLGDGGRSYGFCEVPKGWVAWRPLWPAIAAWNRRAGDDEVEKLRDALRIAIEALDAADMPHTADAIRTALGDTP